LEAGEGIGKPSLTRSFFRIRQLSDEQLVQAYREALATDTDESFLILLREELKRRNIDIEKDAS
jgi:DNA-binding phage protein